MEGYIDLKRLNLDELVGVVNLYPWFGGARMELYGRMMGMGDSGWGKAQFEDAAMYVGSRTKLVKMMRTPKKDAWADSNVETLLKSYISEKDKPSPGRSDVPIRGAHVPGGDFFSQEDYEAVRKSDDNVFSRYAAKARQERSDRSAAGENPEIYTETLAQIYAEQGYYEQARYIYSKLILAYPEKNAYFAALIEKLDELN